MEHLLTESLAYRLLDIAVAVAALLMITTLVVHFLRQPAAKLWVIECALAAGLLLTVTLPLDLPRFSLGFIASNSSLPRTSQSLVIPNPEAAKAKVRAPEIRSAAGVPRTPPVDTGRTDMATEKMPPLTWWQALIFVYVSGAFVAAAWLLLGQWYVWRLLRNGTQPPPSLEQLWDRIDEQLHATIGGRRRPTLLITSSLTHPAAVGIWRPVVLLPASYLELSEDELRPLLAHEWSHCARRDILVRLLAAVFQIVYYYQPLFWWLRRELRVCQEYLADDAAVMVSAHPEQFANQLFSLAQSKPAAAWRPTPVAGILEGRSELYRRIRMLLHPIGQLERGVRLSWCFLILFCLFLLPQGLGFLTLRSVRAQSDPQEVKTDPISPPMPAPLDSIPNQAQLRAELDAGPDDLVGIVLDQENRPIPGVEITFWSGDEFRITSDSKGRFHFKFRDSRSFYDSNLLSLDFAKTGYANHSEFWDVHKQEPPVARLSNQTWIEGIVVGPYGKPAADVLVHVRREEGPPPAGSITTVSGIYNSGPPAIGRTDRSGHYRLLVEPHWYRLQVHAPGIGTLDLPVDDDYPPQPPPPAGKSGYAPHWPKFRIEHGQHRVLDFKLIPGVEFRAKFIDRKTGQPVAGVQIGDGSGYSTTSDPSGVATIPNLPVGHQYFPIMAPGYVQWSSKDISKFAKELREFKRPLVSLTYNIPFEIADGMREVTIELEPGRPIRGRVLDPDGREVAGATIAAVQDAGDEEMLTFSYVSGEDGSYTVYLPASEHHYKLYVHDGKYDELRTWADGIGPTIDAAVSSLDNVELRLTRPGVIRGRLLNEKGEPRAGVYLEAARTDQAEHFRHRARTDREGWFQFPSLASGSYIAHGGMMRGELTEKLPHCEVHAGETTDMGDVVFPRAAR